MSLVVMDLRYALFTHHQTPIRNFLTYQGNNTMLCVSFDIELFLLVAFFYRTIASRKAAVCVFLVCRPLAI
jgi:hypothetical protein